MVAEDRAFYGWVCMYLDCPNVRYKGIVKP